MPEGPYKCCSVTLSVVSDGPRSAVKCDGTADKGSNQWQCEHSFT